MLEDYSTQVFPTCEAQALALLYMNHLDLAGKTPEEIVDAYVDAYARIEKQFRAKCDADTRWM